MVIRCMGGHDQCDLSLKECCYGNRFLMPSAIITMDWHSTTYGRIATWMHALTPPLTPLRLIKIWWTLVFGLVTPEFCRRVCADGLHAALCHAFFASWVPEQQHFTVSEVADDSQELFPKVYCICPVFFSLWPIFAFFTATFQLSTNGRSSLIGTSAKHSHVLLLFFSLPFCLAAGSLNCLQWTTRNFEKGLLQRKFS